MTWWWRNCLKASIHSLRIVLSLTSDFVSRFHQIKISFLACAWLKNLVTEKPKHWQLMNQSCDTESVLYKNVCVSELLPNIRIWKQSFILTEFLKNNLSCTYIIAGWFINFCFGFSVPRVILQFRDFKLYFDKCWIYGSCVTLASMCKKDNFSLENSKTFIWELSKFSKYIGQGGSPTHFKRIYSADLDELEHEKRWKKLWKCHNFGMTPPPSCENSQPFFHFEWILN